ncbi:hypothetical protein BSKO_14017 [Bryopsis sp. KO-2023]|nr:hypothetical protein BSKO_14017 [Bryopsis sp. KO-2023]
MRGGKGSASDAPHGEPATWEDAEAGTTGRRLSLVAQGRSASMVLWTRMAKEDITSTEALVEALNAAQIPEDRSALQEWARAYIEWFNGEPIGNLTLRQGAALKEYSLLAGIQPNSTQQKDILREYFDSLHRKIQEDRLGSASLIEAMEYTLQTMDSDMFERDPTPMFQLGDEFFAKLDPARTIFTKAAYRTHRSMLYVLHQTLRLIQQISPNQLDPNQEDGLYTRFRTKMQAISESAQYYPVCYHARLLEQSLQCLASAGNEACFHDRLRRAGKGLQGILFFYRGVKALATLDVDMDSFKTGYHSLQAAFTSKRIRAESWYGWHQAMQHACLLNMEDAAQHHVFTECLRGLQKKEASMSRPADRKVLRFGLVQQLCLLALEGATAEVRKACVEELVSLANRECWLEDFDILEELLESLAVIAVYSQGDKEKEDAEVALEVLTGGTLGGKAPVQEGIKAWLGCQTLEEKLNILSSPGAGPALGSLFNRINEMLRKGPREAFQALQTPLSIQEVHQALRDHYLHANFAQVRSLFDGQEPKHVDSLHCQLMLIELVKVEAAPQVGGQGERQDHLTAHYERLKQIKSPICLEELFDERRTKPGGPVRDIHKVLLVGNPGTGKTILSRKLAYRWAQGTWGELFEAVYVLPVRALQQSAYDNVSFRRDETLANAIVKNCFSPREDDDYKCLRHRISQTLNNPTTLVVLDGLDERYGASEQLLNQAKEGNHKLLMLSRPYGIEAERSLADIEIEHVGFNDVQLQAFINSELSPEHGTELKAFIREQPGIGLIAHVPVNLQILCALWQDKGEDTVAMNDSISGLYHRLTAYAWHRYMEKHKEEHLQDQDREALFAALGQIAVRGLECGEVVLSQGLVDGVLVEGEGRVWHMLKDAGFLLLQDLGKKYQFPHLTFQEYFAGRWLAKLLLSGEGRERAKAERFFSKHKYEHRFRQTFSFMAGEVSKRREVEDIKQLLNLAEAEPREIVGVQHVLLQVRLLNEWWCVAGEDLKEESADLEEEFHVLESLKGWFQEGVERIQRDYMYDEQAKELLELLTTGLQGFRGFLLEPLLNACQHSDWGVRHVAIMILGKVLETVPGQVPFLLEPLMNTCKDTFREVHLAALELLGKVAEVSPGHAPALQDPLIDACMQSDLGVRHVAIKALKKVIKGLPEHAPALLEPLISNCKDSNWEVCHAALLGLGNVVEAVPGQAPALLEPILNACKHPKWELRRGALEVAVKVVESEPGQAPTLLDPILKFCKDSEWTVRHAAFMTVGKVVQVMPGHAPHLLEPLLSNCNDSDWEVRRAALMGLGKVVEAVPGQAPTLWEPILNGCKDSKWEVRRAALEVLVKMVESELGHAPTLLELLEPLLNAWKESDVVVRSVALELLGRVVESKPEHASSLLDPLLNGCKDSEWDVRRVALEGIVNVVRVVPEQALALLEPLFNACKDSHWTVRNAALLSLGKVVQVLPAQAPALLEPLLNGCKDSKWEVRRAALEVLVKMVESHPGHVLEPLLNACQESDVLVRRVALELLGKVGEVAPGHAPTLEEPLLNACKDSHDLVRCAALTAVVKMVQALPAQAPTLLEPLLNACKDSDVVVRSFAFEHLAKVIEAVPKQAPALLGPILNSCKDSDRMVRHAAFVALGKVVEAVPGRAPSLLDAMFDACKGSLVCHAVLMEAMRKCSIQQLMDGYWATQNQGWVPVLKDRLYSMPLIIRNSPQQGHQRFVLYPPSGQVVNWDKPLEEVQSFVQQVQNAAKPSVGEVVGSGGGGGRYGEMVLVNRMKRMRVVVWVF